MDQDQDLDQDQDQDLDQDEDEDEDEDEEGDEDEDEDEDEDDNTLEAQALADEDDMGAMAEDNEGPPSSDDDPPEEDEEESPVQLKDMRDTSKFINMLMKATIDNDFVDEETKHLLRNPHRTVVDLDKDPNMIFAIEGFSLVSSREAYETFRTCAKKRDPKLDLPSHYMVKTTIERLTGMRSRASFFVSTDLYSRGYLNQRRYVHQIMYGIYWTIRIPGQLPLL